jgi:hypothetical protein
VCVLDLRTELKGSWFWVYGAPPPNGHSLTRDLYAAGARWSSGRRAWYAPDEERAQRVAAAIEGYRRGPAPEGGRETPVQAPGPSEQPQEIQRGVSA